MLILGLVIASVPAEGQTLNPQTGPGHRAATIIDQDQEFDGGSRISLSTLSPVQTQNLAKLAKIWGFLKYHHAAITTGKKHWDYELFRIMPRVLAAADGTAANPVIGAWITSLGAVAACTRCAALDPILLHLGTNLAWLSDESLLGRDLSQTLLAIYRNRTPASSTFYLSLAPGAGNAVFENEPAYPSVKLPDAGYQLLGLFRFWNAVQYYYPYREMMADDPAEASTYWDRVLRESISPLALAADGVAYQQELLKLTARIHDTAAVLSSAGQARPPAGSCQLAVDVRFLEGRALAWRYSTASGEPAGLVQPGDVIEQLDGMAVDELVAKWRPLYAASNEASLLRDIGLRLTRGACGPVEIAVLRGGVSLAMTAERVPLSTLRPSLTHDRPGDAFQLLSPDVAYLKLSTMRAAQSAEYVRAAAGTKALMIDIRGFPAEFVVFTLGSLLAAEPVDFARPTYGDVTNPGTFRWLPPITHTQASPGYTGRVVILVDELTQGSAEYTAMAFRAVPGAIVAGSTTAGTDGNLSLVPLPGGLSVPITGAGVFYPDKRPTQRVGIVPDLEVKPTLEGMAQGRDEVVEEVIRQLDAGTLPPGAAWRDPSVIEFVPIPAGEFTMGCWLGDRDCAASEMPAERRVVRLTKSFELGKYEVTQAQYEFVMGANPTPRKGANLPVDGVSMALMREFMARLNERNDGYRYRLPTEGEWEHAARAGTREAYAGGTADDATWYAGNSGNRAHVVGQKQPNPWGLCDMFGNGGEAVLDLLPNTLTGGLVIDPTGPSTGFGWVWRGGFWGNIVLGVRAWTRGEGAGGFRVYREKGTGDLVTPELSGVRLSSNPVITGRDVTATVELAAPAPIGGAVIALASTNSTAAALSGASLLAIQEGQKSASFTVTAGTTPLTDSTVLSGKMGTETRSAVLTVMAAPGANPGPFGLRFVPIPAGRFTRGGFTVRLTKPFEMGQYEVTQAQWTAVMGDSPSFYKGADLPVERVNWDDAQAFMAKLNARGDGYRYRLPTEAEWEYATLAGGGGFDSSDASAWIGNGNGRTHPVGQKAPNPWWLYDTIGNVWEWTQDWFGPYPVAPVTDPAGASSGTARTYRGGSWRTVGAVRATTRGDGAPLLRDPEFGFRCVRERLDGRPVPVALSELMLAAVTLPAGGGLSGRVLLTAPASAGGTPVTLESSNAAAVTVPASVTVPAGYSLATFAATARGAAGQQAVIGARFGTETRSATVAVTPALGSRTGPFNLEFIDVAPGEFMMGCSCVGENPRFLARLTKGFELGKYEVTQAQWESVMGSNPSTFKGADLPVEQVSWDDIQQFAARLNARNDGYRYRLPTEAEWEYAARAGTDEKVPGGMIEDVAWYLENSGGKTHPVGQKKANAWGFHDMLGNVPEWVRDRFWNYPVMTAADPGNTDTGGKEVRGGGWNGGGASVSGRFALLPQTRIGIGFRVARERALP